MAKATFAKEDLKALVERIEALEEQKTGIAGDIREVYAEAKGKGFDTVILRQVIKLRKLDESERDELDAMLELYFSALGQGR